MHWQMMMTLDLDSPLPRHYPKLSSKWEREAVTRG